jgi:hypothetical protein
MPAAARRFTSNGCPLLESSHRGKIVAIDVDSDDFEVAVDTLTAANQLLARRPDAEIWFERIGHRGVHRFGPRFTRLRGMAMGGSLNSAWQAGCGG